MSIEVVETNTQVSVSRRVTTPTSGIPTMAHVDKSGKFGWDC